MNDERQDNLPFEELPGEEGLFDEQLVLPLPSTVWAPPIAAIIKRDGRQEPFDRRKMARAIASAAASVGAEDQEIAGSIASAVAIYLSKRLNGAPPTADQVSDAVERVLIQMAHAEIALAYARYRDRRARIRRLRHGDMRALLSELEEARHERESAAASDVIFQLRTSQDSLVEWDRNRIVEALQLETGLDPALASLIAAEVEQQLCDAGITTLTTPLVRELVGARLIEHGLVEENELRRRLGVPLYDASRIIRGATPETVGRDPLVTDKALARAVKKEYALSEVFSRPVTQAHLMGDIHLNNLEYVDRLHGGEHTLAWLAENGIRLPGGKLFANPPMRPETLLAQMVKFSDMLEALFADAIGWYAFNYMAAPFLTGQNESQIRAFAETLVYECAYRCVAAAESRGPMRLTLFWNAPQSIADVVVAGPEGGASETVYARLDKTARQLAWAVLDVFKHGDVNDADFPAPLVEVVVDEPMFRTLEGQAYLRHAATIALNRPGLRFILHNNERGDDTGAPLWRVRNVVWHRVALNLPRAAIHAEDEDSFFIELDRLCSLAVEAHKEKRDFIELLLDPIGNAPLSILAQERGGRRYLDLDDACFLVDVDGLFECAEVMLGRRPADFVQRTTFMEKVLDHLSRSLDALSKQAGVCCLLAANGHEPVSRRFATLDVGLYPRLAEQIVKTESSTQALTYTTGVSLPGELALSSFDTARVEGDMHAFLGGREYTRVALPLRNASESTLVDLLKKITHQTRCRGVYFTVPR